MVAVIQPPALAGDIPAPRSPHLLCPHAGEGGDALPGAFMRRDRPNRPDRIRP